MTSSDFTSDLQVFVAHQSVPVAHLHTLPAIFEKAAASLQMPVRALIVAATYRNQELADYIKSVAATVAAEVPRV